ncbi:hypothetical protein EDB83DRAFT_2296564 [Lactarius deliciosus]|nr:hypothetical protein EDB83DRAFT_2296564 [Lactarius deliciosus]
MPAIPLRMHFHSQSRLRILLIVLWPASTHRDSGFGSCPWCQWQFPGLLPYMRAAQSCENHFRTCYQHLYSWELKQYPSPRIFLSPS